jgi:hypothetical protein
MAVSPWSCAGGYSEGFSDLSGYEDIAIVLLQAVVLPFQNFEQTVMVELSSRSCGCESADGGKGGSSVTEVLRKERMERLAGPASGRKGGPASFRRDNPS